MGTTKPAPAQDTNDLLCQSSRRLVLHQVLRFAKQLRATLLDMGVDTTLLNEAMRKSVREFKNDERLQHDCALIVHDLLHLENNEYKVIDYLGRLLVEYCFIQTASGCLVYPRNSKEDIQARKEFTHGVIPRPLMRYFLVSVRGTIKGLDNFTAESLFFGCDNKMHQESLGVIMEVLKDYEVAKPTGGSRFDWHSAYEDQRLKSIALKLILHIRKRIQELQTARYLRIITNIQQTDPDAKGGDNMMDRAFRSEDIREVRFALDAAVHWLSGEA